FEHDFLHGDQLMALKDRSTAVLSEAQALKYFGTSDVIGRTIRINNMVDLSITGVYKTQVKSSDLKFDLLVSLPTLKVLNPQYQDQNFSWIGSNNWTFVKMEVGASATELESKLPKFVEKHLGENFKHWRLRLQPLSAMHFDMRYDGKINKSVLWILSAVAIGLIVMVSINYVNLSIAQANQRSKEIGVRKYLGAERQQLFWQFLFEAFLMVAVSVILSLLTVYGLLPVINTWLHVGLDMTQLNHFENMLYLIVFILLLSLMAGYYPAIFLSGFHPIKAINGKGLGVMGNQNLRKSLIAFQYTIALVFMIGSLVIVRQVDYFLTTDSGFEKDAIVNVMLPKRNHSTLKVFEDDVSRIAGVESVTMHHDGPMSETADGGFIKFDGRPQFENFIVRDRWADEDFAATYSLEFIAGRNIVIHDSITEVLVNESFVRRMSIDDPQDALDKSIIFNNSEVTGNIVGIIKDFHNRSLQNDIDPLAIYPVKNWFNNLSVKIGKGNRAKVLEDVKAKWSASFPEEVFQFSFLDESLANMYEVESVTGKIMRVFTIVSVFTCGMGILGLSVFAIQLRRKEIGIRKVLGASAKNIVILLCAQYIGLIVGAIIVAIPLAFIFASEWLSGFAYHIELNWFLFAMPSVFLTVVTLALIGTQSLKAALANPTSSLKYE
ncbi:MAG: FtsX-like permease family protein, partial [Chryseolinea sp.]